MALCLAQYKPNSMINIFIRPVLTAYLPEAQKRYKEEVRHLPCKWKLFCPQNLQRLIIFVK